MDVVIKRFQHDCDCCEWRFRYGEFDMYFCHRSDGGTIIARYGNEGGEYASYPLHVLFRPVDNPDIFKSSSFAACSRTALDLYMSGRIKVKFEIVPEDPLCKEG